MIYGNKVFESEVLVLHDVEATSINNISISEMFENSIMKDQNVTFEGSLVGKSRVPYHFSKCKFTDVCTFIDFRKRCRGVG